MANVLLFGGSFDPIHHGHLIACRAVAERLGVGRTILIPSALPPHKQHAVLSPAADRLAMCRLAVEGDPQFEVCDWELTQTGPNYTLHTVRHLAGLLAPATELFWLVGADSLAEIRTWHRIAELADACTLATAARPAFQPRTDALRGVLLPAQIERIERHVLPTPLIDISATDIRARVAAGRSIRYLVPAAVERHIAEHRLYARA